MSRAKAKAKGFIYFLRRADGVGPVKIGCSKVPMTRHEQLQAWSPEPLEVVAAVPGRFRDEQRLHRQFDTFRLHGEWFEAAPPVLSAVARAATTGELPPTPTDDKWVRMAAMYQGGKTLQQIGDKFGVSRERVRQILRKAGVPTEGHRPEHRRSSVAWRKEAEVVALARRGNPLSDIAIAVGDCPMNVRTVLKHYGIKVPRKRRGPKPETVEAAWAVAADYRAGMKGPEIAEKHGIAQPQIYRLIAMVGVKPRRHKALDKDAAIRAYKAGGTLKQIAEDHGCSTPTIRRIIDKAGCLRSKGQAAASKRRAA